jgi:hypothetical protein
MTKPISHEVNCETGEVIIRELTQKEIDAIEAQAETTRLQMEMVKAETEAKALAKASAIAKLAALGLTEEEAAAIAGA